MDYLAEPQRRIKAALLSGIRMTTAQGNRIGPFLAGKIQSRRRGGTGPVLKSNGISCKMPLKIKKHGIKRRN